MTISFVGHSCVNSRKRVREIVKEQIQNITIDTDVVTCYLGGYGDFDEICASVCRELKKVCKNIDVVYVTPYISLSEQLKIREMLNRGLYDRSIYPPIENVPPKFAIIRRNEWMVKNADIVIAYINHSYGGAYRSFEAAKQNKKKIVNICDFFKKEI